MTIIEPAASPLPTLADAPRDRSRSPYWAYLARLAAGESRRTKAGCLDRLAAILVPAAGPPPGGYGELIPWHMLDYGHSVGLRAVLAARVAGGAWSVRHANKHLSAYRQVITECWRLGLITAEQKERITDITDVPGSTLPAGRSIHADEIAAMLAACGRAPLVIGTRDAGLIAWLQSTGGRRAEARGQLIEDYDRAERAVHIHGKGNKERIGYLHPEAARYVNQWLAVLGRRRGPMFCYVDRWGNMHERPLSSRAIGLIVDARRKDAGLERLSTHDWRRTFIGDLLDSGADLAQAQQLAGHASPETTAGYDRRPAAQRRAAVDRLTLPAPKVQQSE